MTIYKYAVFGAAAAGVALVAAAVGVRAERQAAGDAYKPAQAIVETLGSKQAIGYYAQNDGACAVTLFIGEAASDEGRIPTAARLRVNVKAGDKAELATAEGQSVEISCTANAAAVEVRREGFKAASVTQ
jgi:hypothetical protein